VYGPVLTVVWQGSAGDRRPYADQHPLSEVHETFGQEDSGSLFYPLKPEDLDMQDGKVIIKADPSKGLPLAKAVRANLFATYSAGLRCRSGINEARRWTL
jgi:hypothetical protein